MNNKKKLIIVFAVIIVITIPLMINILFKYDFNIWWLQSEWSAGEALMFYGSLLSFIGTIILGTITVWQTKKANDISGKLLKNSLIESTAIPHLETKFEIEDKKNEDAKITISTHHKMDYGCIIVTEQCEEDVNRYNQYLLNIYFKCTGKGNNIREILIDEILCVQDPSEDGLYWDDNSSDPIPLGLDIYKLKGNKVYLNWVNEDEFFIQIKVYCPPDKLFDNMMKNDSNLCLMFNFTILNFNGIKTKMHYKLWLQNHIGIVAIKANSTFIENIYD